MVTEIDRDELASPLSQLLIPRLNAYDKLSRLRTKELAQTLRTGTTDIPTAAWYPIG